MTGEMAIANEAKPVEQIDLFAGYSVRLAFFEGPMDLLLYVIEREEIDIDNIPIAEITHQYLDYIEIMRMLDIEVAGEFMVMAARLMQIKARMLLPLSVEEDEEFDPREGLIQALMEYRRFKKAAELMSDMESMARLRYPARLSHDGDGVHEIVPLEVNLFDLLRAFREVSQRQHEEVGVLNIQKLATTVEERIEYLKGIIIAEGLRFKDIFHPVDSRLLIIVTFIALLELTRLRVISVRQNQLFGEIWIYKI